MINGIEMGSPTISVFMDRDMDAIAYFSPISVMPKQFELVVEVVGQGKIDVTNDQTTVVYQDVQGTVGQFNEGSKVDAVMSPGQGYAFSKWVLNDLEVSDQSLQFIMDEDKLVQAYFEPVIVHPDPKGSITVEFVDQDTNSKVKADVTLTDLPLGNQSYTADSIIGIYKLIGDAVKQVVLSATEPFKRLPFFINRKPLFRHRHHRQIQSQKYQKFHGVQSLHQRPSQVLNQVPSQHQARNTSQTRNTTEFRANDEA